MSDRRNTSHLSKYLVFTIITALTLNIGCSSPQTKSPPSDNEGVRPAITGADHARCPTGDWRNQLVIHHIDVEQGDSTFIRTPSGTTILIDAGKPKYGPTTVRSVLKQCYNADSVDYLVASHFHLDHYGGLLPLITNIKEFEIKRAIYDPGDDAISEKDASKMDLTVFREFAESRKLRKVLPLGSNAFDTLDDVRVTVVARAGKVEGYPERLGSTSDPNTQSIALKISYGNFDYFTGGDLTGGGNRTADLESKIAPIVSDVDVLRANHHGSKTSSNAFFVETLKPENVVISVGANSYGHPNPTVLERLLGLSNLKRVFTTNAGALSPTGSDRRVKNADGDVVIVAGKESYSINGETYQTDNFAPVIRSTRLSINNHDPEASIVQTKAMDAESSTMSNPGIIKGNVKTYKFHKPTCHHYNCQNCTMEFSSSREAVDSGYVACKLCH